MEKQTTRAIKMDRLFMIVVPIAIFIISYLIINCLVEKNNFIINSAMGLDNLKTMLGVWGTLLGFWITAISILLTLGNGKYVDMLIETGHHKTVLLSYVVCCVHLLIAVLIAVFLIFTMQWNMCIFSIACSLVIDTMFLVAICLFFLICLVINVQKS